MAVDLGKRPARPIDFTLDGKKLAAKPLPFKLFMQMMTLKEDDGSIPLDVMASMVLALV